jgi:hypothetical protein
MKERNLGAATPTSLAIRQGWSGEGRGEGATRSI